MMPKVSSSSAEVFSVDLPALEQALQLYVAEVSQRPEVLQVVLFGSFATGRYAPGSDVDLLVVLSQSTKRFRDRIPDYLPALFPVDVDVFPYTAEEVRRLSLPQEALRTGKVLWRRPGPEPSIPP
jgi:predicted nucleotidyltransferase